MTTQKPVDFLVESARIGAWSWPRYNTNVDLDRNTLFKNLVDLYLGVLQIHWHRFSRLIHLYKIGADEPDMQRWAAAVYVSTWFHDLYVSNHKACVKAHICSEIYQHDLFCKSKEYDLFLSALNAQIRPTCIKSTFMDTVYIPRIFHPMDLDAVDGNFWHIDGWELNDFVFYGMVSVMKDKQIMSFEPLSEDATGRHAWLFDWHDDSYKAYAWFPMEPNYTLDDVAIAYIVGGPYTPTLAPCDRDECQQFPGNIVPAHIDKTN